MQLTDYSAASESATSVTVGQEIDISNCSREPIHIPGRIQPHGSLLAGNAQSLLIEFVSENLEKHLGIVPKAVLGQSFSSIFTLGDSEETWPHLQKLPEGAPKRIQLRVNSSNQSFSFVVHKFLRTLILEFEPDSNMESVARSFSKLHEQVRSTSTLFEKATSLSDLCAIAAEEVKRVSNYDRVMIYQFDKQWNGRVIAESKEPDMDPFLGLHYPASDIPAQARALYEKNWLRIIPDVNYTPSALLGISDGPLDLSFSALRSVSPVHLQYLKNMEVGASMSISIMKEQKLWGLIACHHRTKNFIPFETREALEFIGRVFSLHLSTKTENEDVKHREEIRGLQSKLHEQTRKSPFFLHGLLQGAVNITQIARGVGGAAIYYRGDLFTLGATPSHIKLRSLVQWLRATQGSYPLFVTDRLPKLFAEAKSYKDMASGLLSISLPEPDTAYIMLFKPEVIQTVNWAGNPEKPVEIVDSVAQLSPRRSFELWKETVQHQSTPWGKEEVDIMELLRRSVIEEALHRQVTEVLKSNEELDEYAYVISHDLKEPLRGIETYAGFLKLDSGDKLDPESRFHLDVISTLSKKTRSMITELYEYSKLGKVDLAITQVDVNQIVDEVKMRLHPILVEKSVKVEVPEKLPIIEADRVRLEEVFANLFSNAIKYNENERKWIRVTAKPATDGKSIVFTVADNGIGMRPEDQQRVFRMFERLHPMDHYGGGTGSGLAIVKRIIERHYGRIWIESELGAGSSFHFSLGSPQSRSAILGNS